MTAEFKRGMLWCTPEAVARNIQRAIEKRQDVSYAPWSGLGIMAIARLILERIFKKTHLKERC